MATPHFTLSKCERLLVFSEIPFILSAGTLQHHVCPSLNYKFNSQNQICPLFISSVLLFFISVSCNFFSFLAFLCRVMSVFSISGTDCADVRLTGCVPTTRPSGEVRLETELPWSSAPLCFPAALAPGRTMWLQRRTLFPHLQRTLIFPRENWNYWEDWRAAQPAATIVAWLWAAKAML